MCVQSQIYRAAPVMVVSWAASHQSHTIVLSRSPCPKRTRVTNTARRTRVIRCMGQRSPKLKVKWLLRMTFWKVHIRLCALLGQAWQVEVKKMWAKRHTLIGVTRSQRSTARAHIRSHVINAWHGVSISFNFTVCFGSKVHCALLVGSLSCLFCISPPCNQCGWVVYFVSAGIKWSN